MKFSVYLDGKIKGRNLSFKDAVRLSTDLAKSIGWRNFTKRIQIVAQEAQ